MFKPTSMLQYQFDEAEYSKHNFVNSLFNMLQYLLDSVVNGFIGMYILISTDLGWERSWNSVASFRIS